MESSQLSSMSRNESEILARIPSESPSPIMQVGYDGNLLYANQAFFNIECFRDSKIGAPVGQVFKGLVNCVINSGLKMETEIKDADKEFLFILTPVPDLNSVFLYGHDITARKQSERQLKQMSLISSEMNNAVIIGDAEGRVEWVNRGFEKTFGYTLDEVRGKIPGEFLQGPDTDPEASEKIRLATINREILEEDILRYSKFGTPIWTRLQFQPVFNPSGRLINFISIQKDITEEKLLQKEVIDNEQKLRLILESSLDGVILFDEQTRILNWTPQSELIFGYSPEEVMGKPLVDILIPSRLKENHLNWLKQNVSVKMARLTDRRAETIGLRKNGEEFPLEITIISIRQNDSTILCSFIRDISERKEWQGKLERSNSRLSALITNLNSGILVEDEFRNIALINQTFCSMFGIPVDPEYLIGSDCSQSAEQSKHLFKDPEGFVKTIDEILLKQEIVLDQELELVDGRYFKRDYIPIFFEGAFLGNLWYYKDITQRKQNDRLLELSRLAAEDATRAKSTFLANMSHEIRTPMSAVHGIVRLLADAPHLPEQVELHQRLIGSSETMLAIINDILDFSKIEAGLMTIEETSFSLNDVFKRILGSMEIKASQKSLSLVHSIDDQITQVLIGDPTRIGQVLLNLINNAIKFTDQGQVKVEAKIISTNGLSDTIQFSVSDTGIGIEKSHLNKIFQSFEQENSSTARQYGGTGLGLSISKQLVELMGGELVVDSEKNKGSNFRFNLTLKRSLNKSMADQESKMVIDFEKLKGRKVLIVEDNEMNQYVAKSILTIWKMEIFQARNGKKAIDFLANNSCDIILMDKQMPVMDGIEATRYIRDVMNSDIPIIALTADALLEKVQECLAAGMNDFVTKPFEPEILYTKIVSLLDR